MEIFEGFSGLSRDKKIQLLLSVSNYPDSFNILETFRLSNEKDRKIIEDLSENTLSSFHLPLSIAPNFLINGCIYHIPMVTEESSVVAAASSAAKFWARNGGFQCEIISVEKKGQIHFIWHYGIEILDKHWEHIKNILLEEIKPFTEKMKKRGGGILEISLCDMTAVLDDYYQIDVSFDTVDAMGANFINTCLEHMGDIFKNYIIKITGNSPEVIMSILSNYTPKCLVNCSVECEHEDLDKIDGETGYVDFIKKFEKSVAIANANISRAVTHNKGIFNGMDAVLIATGNDFRAVEAGGHAYASRNGIYSGLTNLDISNGRFIYNLTVPITVGVVGGATAVHPQVKWVMKQLKNPNAKELMTIIISAGLANNFSAIRSLVTNGIQRGHMKMHLRNILNRLSANENQRNKAEEYFANKEISYMAVENFIKEMS